MLVPFSKNHMLQMYSDSEKVNVRYDLTAVEYTRVSQKFCTILVT